MEDEVLKLFGNFNIFDTECEGECEHKCDPCEPKCDPCEHKKPCDPCEHKKPCDPCEHKKPCDPCEHKKPPCHQDLPFHHKCSHECDKPCDDVQYIPALNEMNQCRQIIENDPVELLTNVIISRLRSCEGIIKIKNSCRDFVIDVFNKCPDACAIKVSCNSIIRTDLTLITLKSFCDPLCNNCNIIVVGPCAKKVECDDSKDNECKTFCCEDESKKKCCYKVYYQLDYAKKVCGTSKCEILKMYDKLECIFQYIFNGLPIRKLMDSCKNALTVQVQFNHKWYNVAIIFVINCGCEKVIVAKFLIDNILYVLALTQT